MTLNELKEALRLGGIEAYEYEARELFYSVGKTPRSTPIFANTTAESEPLFNAIARRLSGEPLQYIVGEVGFFRETYLVSPDCLIPRADTEILVELAVKRLKNGADFLDLCTGSGCIAISTLKNTTNTTCRCADLSQNAFEMAKKNAKRNGVEKRLTPILADVLTAEGRDLITEGKTFDAILSNPPYVSLSAYTTLEKEIYYEPRMAFVGGGEDGGDFYRIMTPLYLPYVKEGGFIAYEIGFDGAPIMEEVARDNGLSLEIIKDYGANDRVAVLTSPTKR